MLAKLKDNLDAKKFLPMERGHWYQIELSAHTENMFNWIYIPGLAMTVDRQHLEFKQES